MKLRSNTQSAIPAPKNDLSKTGKKEPGYTIKDKVDDLHKEEDNLGEDINKLKEMGVKKREKSKKNNKVGMLAGILGTVGCFTLAAVAHAAGGSIGGVLPLIAMIGLPWTFLILTSRSNQQNREAVKHDSEAENVKQQQQEVHKSREWWEEKKVTADKIVEASKNRDDSSVPEIINEEKSVTIGGIKLKKRR
ncbi:MAG: hypothetical protein K8T10_16950 [Candidatus Eremiobacteraeota bacterium]|nr:hypothetical protein [Candidatus Eremiobacteraeota bacterium]